MVREQSRSSVFSGGKGVNGSAPKNNEPTREILRAENKNPLPFEGTIKTEFMTTTDLAKRFNTFMSTIFEDWHGSVVTITEKGDMNVQFIFRPVSKPSGEKDRRAFIPVAEKKSTGNTIMDTIAVVNSAARRNDNFVLSDDAAELLYDMIMPGTVNQYKINPFNSASYKPIVTETFINNMTGGVIYCIIDGIDINRMLAKIYGSKDSSDQSQVLYLASPVRPLANLGMNYSPAVTWLVNISAMSRSKYEKLMGNLGVIPNNGEYPAVTEKA